MHGELQERSEKQTFLNITQQNNFLQIVLTTESKLL